MTPQAFCQRGTGEGLKGTAHAVAAGLLALMAAYNTTAFLLRRERHLAIHACVYGLGAVYEIKQTCRHWSRTC